MISENVLIFIARRIGELDVTVRREVMQDRDLAELYGVETRVLNQAVKRNETRLPEDFMFHMTKDELENWIKETTSGIYRTRRRHVIKYTQ